MASSCCASGAFADVVTLFPFPPETKSKDGECDGLLSCGCFYGKDCIGTWKNKKFVDIVKAIEEDPKREDRVLGTLPGL